MVKTNYFHLREIWLWSHISSGQVRSGHWVWRRSPTWGSGDVHLLQVLTLQDAHSQLARGWHVAKRETNITQVLQYWWLASGKHRLELWWSPPDRPLWLIVCPSIPQWSEPGPPCREEPSPHRSTQNQMNLRDPGWPGQRSYLVMLGKSVVVKNGKNQRLVKGFAIWKL